MSVLVQFIKRCLAGKSSSEYLRRLTGGSDQYWDRGWAAQIGRSTADCDVTSSPNPKDTWSDIVETTSEDSFPASDPPGWTPTTGVGPLQ
jgi:hypothetical protein